MKAVAKLLLRVAVVGFVIGVVAALGVPAGTARHAAARTPGAGAPSSCQGIWTITPSPALRGGTINDIAVVARNAVWAVGSRVSDVQSPSGFIERWRGFIERWTGRRWRLVYSGAGEFGLSALAGTAPDDVWAVGNRGGRPLILHWNGRVWQEVASPRVDGGLDGVAARSRSDVWAIGNRLDFAYGAAYTLVEHWNGREWKIVPSANRVLYDKADNGLSSVAPISGHDVWVVGSFWDGINDTGGSLIEQWNGHRWHIVPSPAGLDRLHAIGVASARDIWAAGDHSDGNTFRPLVERWDGQRWRILYRPPLSGSFWAMLVRSPNDVWFLGESRSRPLVRRWNGTGFRDAAAPSIPGGVIEAAAQTGNVVWAGGGTRALKTSRPFIARYLCRP